MKDLDEAIKTARRDEESTPDDHPDLASRLKSLGGLLQDRYGRAGDISDLAEAIETSCIAVELTPDNHPDLARRLGNLGALLLSRYQQK